MKRKLTMALFITALFIMAACKKSEDAVIARVNGVKVFMIRKILENKENKHRISDISQAIETELLIQESKRLGKWDTKEILDNIEKRKPYAAYEMYIRDLKKTIIITDEEARAEFNKDPKNNKNDFESHKTMVKKDIERVRLEKKILEIASDLKKKYPVEIKVEYLDFEKYDPKMTSLVVAVVNNEKKITNNELSKEYGRLIREDPSATLNDALSRLIARVIIWFESAKYIDSPEMKKDIEQMKRVHMYAYMKRNYLFELYPVTEENVRKFYDENLDKYYTYPKRAKLRYILFDKDQKEKAEEVLKGILKSKNPKKEFLKKAKEYARGPEYLQENAGDLGEVPEAALPADFAKEVFALKDGEIAPRPLWHEEFGWELIYCEYKKPQEIEKFENIKDKVVKDYRENVITFKEKEVIKDIVSRSKIKIYVKDYDGAYSEKGGYRIK